MKFLQTEIKLSVMMLMLSNPNFTQPILVVVVFVTLKCILMSKKLRKLPDVQKMWR